MPITLERIIDKIVAQAPLYIGIGIAGYVGYQLLLKALESKEKGQGGQIGHMPPGSGSGGARGR